MNTNLEQH